MIFTHDTQAALQAAAGLVNTLPDPSDPSDSGDPSDPGDSGDSGDTAAADTDALVTTADLEAFVEDYGWTGSRSRGRAELDAVRRLRPRLQGLWALAARPTPDQLVAEVNDILREAEAMPQMVRHDGFGWHIHATTEQAPLATRMAVEAAMAMVDVIRADELGRLRTCAAEDCAHVLVDLSRNRSRRFCEGGCGNRINVRAYRERQAAEE